MFVHFFVKMGDHVLDPSHQSVDLYDENIQENHQELDFHNETTLNHIKYVIFVECISDFYEHLTDFDETYCIL